MRIQICSSMLVSNKALGVAVGLSPALVPCWAETVAAYEALLLVRLSTWVVMAARADVRVHKVFFTSLRVNLSS